MRIALLMAALNDVDIWAADALNAYITAPCREKIWTTLGKEFGDDCGRKDCGLHAVWTEVEQYSLQGASGRMHARNGLRVVPC